MTAALTAYARGGAGIDAIELREVAVPDPRPGEVLIGFTAATLNYRDLIGVRGALPGMTREPEYIPLSCAVGVVEAVGDGVARFSPGDRVMPQFALGWTDGGVENIGTRHLGGQADGVARTHGVFEAAHLSAVPDELGDLEAATLPCAGITAWSAVTGARAVARGDWVLVQGTGGVSLAALQWAKALGAQVIVTSSSNAKLRRATALGADAAINYRATPAWGEAARALTEGRGVDLIVDVAGSGELAQSEAAIAAEGVVAAIGMLEGGFNWGRQSARGAIVPVTVGSLAEQDRMLSFAAAHGVRPVVDRVYPLKRLGDALRHLESGRFFGKIAISLQ